MTKHSEKANRSRGLAFKKLGLISAILSICFALGFGMGALPNQWRALLGKRPAHLRLLVSSENLIPKEFLYEYEKISGHKVEVQTIVSYHLFRSEAQQADLLFAPLSWLGNFSEILKPLPQNEKWQKALATDFATLKLNTTHFLPVLWKPELRENHTHLLFWGFATTSADPPSEVQELLDFLLSNSVRQKEWAARVPLAFTSQSSNSTADFPSLQKAESFRQVSLDELIIDQKFK